MLRAQVLTREHGVLVSDRATALLLWTMKRRQICLAHLMRKFVAFSERDGPAGDLGDELVQSLALVFAYWKARRQGTLSRAKFRAWMAPVRAELEALLQRVVDAKIPGMSGSCADILAHKDALWTFVQRDDVEPTSRVGSGGGGFRLPVAGAVAFAPAPQSGLP